MEAGASVGVNRKSLCADKSEVSSRLRKAPLKVLHVREAAVTVYRRISLSVLGSMALGGLRTVKMKAVAPASSTSPAPLPADTRQQVLEEDRLRWASDSVSYSRAGWGRCCEKHWNGSTGLRTLCKLS